MDFYPLFSLLLSVGLQLWYSHAYFEIAPVSLVWSYCCYEGNVFTLERCFIWLALKSFFSSSSIFKNTANIIVWASKEIKKKNVFWQYAIFFCLSEWLWNSVFLKQQQGNISVFLIRKKSGNILSDLRNILGAIPVWWGMLWVANRSGSRKGDCPLCVVFNRASLTYLALLCLNILYLLKSNC